jgi:hypothetical protein
MSSMSDLQYPFSNLEIELYTLITLFSNSLDHDYLFPCQLFECCTSYISKDCQTTEAQQHNGRPYCLFCLLKTLPR